MKLSVATELLRRGGVESPAHDARAIFRELGGYSEADCRTEDIDTEDERVIRAIERRAEREPLQYILGYAYFYREKYTVTSDCLIPRADTEILVDYGVKNIPSGERFLDLCAGSGCVGISTLKNTKGTECVFADISEAALEIAKKNAHDNGVFERAEFVLADVTKALPEGDFFAVLANPPYVSESAYLELEKEIYREPKIAFLGGADGADIYRSLIPLAKPRLKPHGFMALEIGYDQGEILKNIAKENGFSCEILKDLSGNDRVAVLKPVR